MTNTTKTIYKLNKGIISGLEIERDRFQSDIDDLKNAAEEAGQMIRDLYFLKPNKEIVEALVKQVYDMFEELFNGDKMNFFYESILYHTIEENYDFEDLKENLMIEEETLTYKEFKKRFDFEGDSKEDVKENLDDKWFECEDDDSYYLSSISAVCCKIHDEVSDGDYSYSYGHVKEYLKEELGEYIEKYLEMDSDDYFTF